MIPTDMPPGTNPIDWQPAVDLVSGWEVDHGIRDAVLCLICHGVETVQSCQGGPGHSYPEPTVDLLGGRGAGMHALSVAQTYLLPVTGRGRSARGDRRCGQASRPTTSGARRPRARTRRAAHLPPARDRRVGPPARGAAADAPSLPVRRPGPRR